VTIYQTDYGILGASTTPGATCSARGVLPNGQAVAGLSANRVADSSGKVVWQYPQPPTDQGSGRHYVTCSLGGLNGSDSAAFQVGS
jgi:hypothetical protein